MNNCTALNRQTLRSTTLRAFAVVAVVTGLTACTSSEHAQTSSSTSRLPKSQAVVTPQEWSEEFHESWSRYHCTADTVLSGRAHRGDEHTDGWTKYKCATLTQFGKPVTTGEQFESGNIEENWHIFECPTNMAMNGREHDDDENGDTRYYCVKLTGALGELQLTPGAWSAGVPENKNTFECPANQVLVGRRHDSDENGDTFYKCASIW